MAPLDRFQTLCHNMKPSRRGATIRTLMLFPSIYTYGRRDREREFYLIMKKAYFCASDDKVVWDLKIYQFKV